MSKRAIILAGGKGTRLKPYTVVLPKPLVPIGKYPILEIVIRQLVENGFTHITMAVSHYAELIQAFFGNGSKWDIKIDYSLEDMPLSTMGPLRLIHDLPKDFLIMNGDILTNLDYSDFHEHHVKHHNLFTVSACQRNYNTEYGVLEVDRHGMLCGFKEKPVISHTVSMGIYMANKKIIDLIPKNKTYGFNHLMLSLIKTKRPVAIKKFDGYWLDIGRPADYGQAVEIFEKRRNVFLREDLP